MYPRPDGTVYICGEAESVDVPEDPSTIQPRKAAVKALQVTRKHPYKGSSPLNARDCHLHMLTIMDVAKFAIYLYQGIMYRQEYSPLMSKGRLFAV